MPCNIKSYDLISHDADWLKRTLPGVDLEVASEISKTALRKVMDDRELDYDYPLPRNTLVIVARKMQSQKWIDAPSAIKDRELVPV